eukprot:TRINITY_DN23054_c0_g1_i5.p1 TRINITY_DN23054_c0_g1~~TRINITY_DN23054_c0_g1_i5.p1  ORF type:complete len:771 (-),score=144.81 TRINITY_DN23054_c0_g1_i5:129-2300(-)
MACSRFLCPQLRFAARAPIAWLPPVRSKAGITSSPQGTPAPDLERVHDGLRSLRRVLDDRVVGQSHAKEAVLLALLAREHAYIEGPPGVAKTYLAELVSGATDLSLWFYQMHRDTRLNEIVGEAVILKEQRASGEVIRQDIVPGGILNCEIAVLDDISRAPGEALNVLLRILNERRYQGVDDRIPLLSAIATGNPAQDDAYYAEALDPATLDRFTLQLRTTGLVNAADWEGAEAVIDAYSGPPLADDGRILSVVGRDVLLEASELTATKVCLGEPTKQVLLDLLRALRNDHGLREDNSLLTDRTFLIKAVKVLKARAVLSGRLQCKPEDLYAMRYLTTFRIPADVHAKIDEIIAEILARHAARHPPAGAASKPGGDDAQDEAASSDVDESAAEGDHVAGQPTPSPDAVEQPENATQRQATAMLPPNEPSEEQLSTDDGNVGSLESLLRTLAGRLQKGRAAREEHPGGLPRGWSRLRTLGDSSDADAVATARWCAQPVPQLPHAQRRTRPKLGGRVAIIRDNSLSMQGPWNSWASLLCPRVLELAKRFQMRVGYVEFNQIVDKFLPGDAFSSRQFFTRDYKALSDRMQDVRCKGYTNYELALDAALSEFRRGGSRATTMPMCGSGLVNRAKRATDQHILFITDGHPSTGDVTVVREIKAARALGVALHTIFIGYGDVPPVLDKMSLLTNGTRHAASFIPGSIDVQVVERVSDVHGSGYERALTM